MYRVDFRKHNLNLFWQGDRLNWNEDDLEKRILINRAGELQKHSFKFKNKLFSLDASLLDVSMKVFPHAEYNRMKSAYKLHIGLDHDGLIPAFAAVTVGKVGDQTSWGQPT